MATMRIFEDTCWTGRN